MMKPKKKSSNPDFQELGEQFYKTRSKEDFEKLYEGMKYPLHYYIEKMVGLRLSYDEKKDLLSDTFLSIGKFIERYDNTYKFSTWVYTACTRLFWTMMRNKAKSQRLNDNESINAKLGIKASRSYDADQIVAINDIGRLNTLNDKVRGILDGPDFTDRERDLIYGHYAEGERYVDMKNKYAYLSDMTGGEIKKETYKVFTKLVSKCQMFKKEYYSTVEEPYYNVSK
ncbi:MAG: sigma-70 family RNA polymerase sigma factor [Methanomicrobia archaeon]|nr:sigma-70 family RNA polymerase sigma factor [Methanomicrobia archaeon]